MRFPPSAMTAVIASMSLLFISPTMTLGYTNTFQSTPPSLSNQTLTSNNNTGAVILEGFVYSKYKTTKI
jgi:hypothetical protein